MAGFRYSNQPTAAQKLWRECCASVDQHRFDCTEVPPEKRGRGPFLPTKTPSAAELIAKMRTREAGE